MGRCYVCELYLNKAFFFKLCTGSSHGRSGEQKALNERELGANHRASEQRRGKRDRKQDTHQEASAITAIRSSDGGREQRLPDKPPWEHTPAVPAPYCWCSKQQLNYILQYCRTGIGVGLNQEIVLLHVASAGVPRYYNLTRVAALEGKAGFT